MLKTRRGEENYSLLMAFRGYQHADSAYRSAVTWKIKIFTWSPGKENDSIPRNIYTNIIQLDFFFTLNKIIFFSISSSNVFFNVANVTRINTDYNKV